MPRLAFLASLLAAVLGGADGEDAAGTRVAVIGAGAAVGAAPARPLFHLSISPSLHCPSSSRRRLLRPALPSRSPAPFRSIPLTSAAAGAGALCGACAGRQLAGVCGRARRVCAGGPRQVGRAGLLSISVRGRVLNARTAARFCGCRRPRMRHPWRAAAAHRWCAAAAHRWRALACAPWCAARDCARVCGRAGQNGGARQHAPGSGGRWMGHGPGV